MDKVINIALNTFLRTVLKSTQLVEEGLKIKSSKMEKYYYEKTGSKHEFRN